MSGSRDMTAPNWKRTVAAARKMMARLRELDVQCIEPPNFDVPPAQRTSAVRPARPASPVEVGPDTGHGHVRPRADGLRARCGGPGLCSECSQEQAKMQSSDQGRT